MSQTLTVSDATIGNRTLSVTTRDCGDTPEMMEELTYRTIKAWLWIVSQLEQGIYTLPLTAEGDALGSVEMRLSNEFIDHDAPMFDEVEGDARVTVWDTFKSQSRIGFHLNSSDIPQVAVDTWLANHKAIDRILAEQSQNTPKTAPQAHSSASTPSTGTSTPSVANGASNDGVAPLLTKKEALAKLQPGSPFRMKVVQIEKHSKDGADFYEFFEPWGGKAGQYSATSVFVDNEIAVNNGLIAYLDTLGVKLGQALTGNWIVNAAVGKPKTKTIKGEKKTFTNIYVNSFEGQPQPTN